MTRQLVTDEQYGQLCRRLDEVKRRVSEGTLPLEPTMVAVQRIVEGKGQFPLWKTIWLGTHRDALALRRSILDQNNSIFDWADDMLQKTPVISSEVTIDLIRATGAELGCSEYVAAEQIYAKAKEFGLELCPAEVGPQLRLQYQNQPNGECLLIAMNPIIDSVGCAEVFAVERAANESWIRSCCGDGLTRLWSPSRVWVFARRK